MSDLRYRVMDDYIQELSQDGYWTNIAKVIDLPKCRHVAWAASKVDKIYAATDTFLSTMIELEEITKKET